MTEECRTKVPRGKPRGRRGRYAAHSIHQKIQHVTAFELQINSDSSISERAHYDNFFAASAIPRSTLQKWRSEKKLMEDFVKEDPRNGEKIRLPNEKQKHKIRNSTEDSEASSRDSARDSSTDTIITINTAITEELVNIPNSTIIKGRTIGLSSSGIRATRYGVSKTVKESIFDTVTTSICEQPSAVDEDNDDDDDDDEEEEEEEEEEEKARRGTARLI